MKNFIRYNYLGFHNPYFIRSDNTLKVSNSLSELLENSKLNELDFTSVVQILNKGYAFGDRTLIKNVNRTPWMAKPDEKSEKWEYSMVPIHGEAIEEQERISSKFYCLLREELFEYTASHKTIGILLTGGMDSRIVACLLNDMIKSGELLDRQVLAMTWGQENSRDVVYARRIADLFGWEWEHIPVDVSQMSENITLALEVGCEFSPIHLHSMSKVARRGDIDCVIAGSFGDSIGRGEYSGTKVKHLSGLNTNIKNVAGLLRPDFRKLAQQDIMNDISKYHSLYPQQFPYQQYEQDMQLHYMRRMLNPCMSIINAKIPLYQCFTSPKVFGYIWSISPNLRDDNIYKIILETNNPKLLDIPWARTGLRYPSKEGQPDSFSRSHHDYGKMIRKELMGTIEMNIRNSHVADLNIFNPSAIERLIKFCKARPINNSFYYEDKLIWISSVAKFVSKYDLKTDLKRKKESPKSFFISNFEYGSKYLWKRYR